MGCMRHHKLDGSRVTKGQYQPLALLFKLKTDQVHSWWQRQVNWGRGDLDYTSKIRGALVASLVPSAHLQSH